MDRYRKYDVKYHSSSRGTDVEISDAVAFHDAHLVNAFNKRRRDMEQALSMYSDPEQRTEELCALAREMGYRDLSPDHKTGRAPDDDRNPGMDRNDFGDAPPEPVGSGE